MASLRCAAPSPASPQLRFGCRRRGAPAAALLRLRFCPPNPRHVVFASASAAAAAAGSTDGDRREPQRSSTAGDGSPDAFAGWSDDGSGTGEMDENGGGVGGMLGVGLAGIIFATGVTFAALSLANKNTSGGKQQMAPLTREEGVLLMSNYTIGENEQIDDESSAVLSDKESKISNYNPDNETAPQVLPGRVLVPPVVDQFQGQALAALQVLKVIEVDVQPVDLCTRREYARWLVSASNILSRNTTSKVYPAMYVENLTELAFDDVTPEDPDFPYIQGLAEAGLISSKLSLSDLTGSFDNQQDYICFYPDRPVSRQDLVSWKMALDPRQLPEVDKNLLYQCTSFIDIEKINRDAWPALVADIAAGEQSIIALAFGYTRLFQPDKPVTKAQVAMALATGDAAEIVIEELARIEAEALAETAVTAHTALVEQVENDLNSSFENELAREKEKTEALEKLAEETRRELDQLRIQREEENSSLMRDRAAVESEIYVLSKLRHDMEEQLQSLMTDKLEISYEKERINKLLREAESENQRIAKLQYELEVEKRALSMAKTWAEEEAKRAREQARILKEARERWEGHGIEVVVGEDVKSDASIGTIWQTVGEQPAVDETIIRGESLVEKLKEMAAEIKLRFSSVIEKIIQRIVSLVSFLKQQAYKTSKRADNICNGLVSTAKSSIDEFQENASSFTSAIGDRARRVVEDCKDGVGRITQKFKT